MNGMDFGKGVAISTIHTRLNSTGREPGHGEGEEGVALAPNSIDCLSIEYIENGETEVATFSSDGKVYGDNEGEWTFYIYEKLSENTARVTYTFENEPNPQPEVETLTFTSRDGGTYSWIEYTDAGKTVESDQSTGEFRIVDGSGHTDGPDDRQKVEEKPEFVNIPISDVEEFVSRFVDNETCSRIPW